MRCDACEGWDGMQCESESVRHMISTAIRGIALLVCALGSERVPFRAWLGIATLAGVVVLQRMWQY
jgi:hypothetical protein